MNPVIHRWSGGITGSSVNINARVTTDSTTVRAVLALDSLLTTPVAYSDFATANVGNNRTVTLSVLGLVADTTYYYGIESGGVVDGTKLGRFKTFPTAAASFTFAFSADNNTASPAVFTTMDALDPLFFIHMGDFHYQNIDTNNVGLYRSAYDTQLAGATQSAFYKNRGIAYVWDDHDYGGNDSYSSNPGKTAAAQVYREYVPHYPLQTGENTTNGIYHAFTVGRVRFIVTDNRYYRDNQSATDNASKSMLGATQKAWFKEELLAGQQYYALTVWVNSSPWIDSTGTDSWAKYQTERTEIANFIKDNSITRLTSISGDMHGVAIDDGRNNNYATGGGGSFPICQSSALNQTGSLKGGPYSKGYVTGSGQFSLMSIVDTGGNEVSFTWSCRNTANTQLITYSHTFSLIESPVSSSTTYQPVRLAPALLGIITTANQTITNCGPFKIDGHFIKSSLGIEDYPKHVYFHYYKYIQPGDGYGYTPDHVCTNEQTVIATLYSDAYGIQTYVGELVANDCEPTLPFVLSWNGSHWQVSGITFDSSPFFLVGGTSENPLLARGEANVFVGGYTTYTVVDIGFAIPLSEGYGYGYSSAQFHYTVGYGGNDVGYGLFPAPGQPGSIQNNDGNIAQSQSYHDNEIVEVEIEVVSKNGVHYLPTSQYNPVTGYFSHYFVPEWNDVYSFRVRGFSEHNFSTSFGNTFQLVVNVAPSVITNVIKTPQYMVPDYGLLLAFIRSSATFYYEIAANCYGTFNVQYSLDRSAWQVLTDKSGQFDVPRLTQGLHTISVRTQSNDGQISVPDTMNFYVSLSTFVTIDIYPIAPLCGPGRTATISGSREAGAIITDIRGIIPTTLRHQTPTTWEADIYVLGTEKQIIDITVTNFAGLTANVRQEIFMEVRPPKLYVRPLDDLVFINKAFVEGIKEAGTDVQISHNNGAWTTAIPYNSLTSFRYVIELVSGENQIDVRSADLVCGFASNVSTIITSYVDPAFISGAFNINGGDNYTTTPLVSLNFASTTASRIKVSNFEDFREGFVTPYVEQLNWFLLEFPGVSRIYIQFLNDLDLASIVYTDDILLTASAQVNNDIVTTHLVISLQATDLITNTELGTVVRIVNKHNGIYEIEIYADVTTALAGTPLLATASTTLLGKQTLILSDAGSGSVIVSGTIEVDISKDSPDVYLDHRNEIFDPATGESVVPLQYSIIEDADFFYAQIELPYYESKFVGHVQKLVEVTATTTVVDIDKVFVLIQSLNDGYGYGYGYGYGHFAQAIPNCPSALAESFATYPLNGLRMWYPTLPVFANVIKVEQFDTFYRLTLDQSISQFDPEFACRLEFTRQNKWYTDYRIRKLDGLVEFINESTYATGNVQFDYIYARPNKGRPDTNWYKLCGLKFNDLVVITIPQTQSKITFAELNKLRVRFYNGDEGTAPAIVRFIINDVITFEDHQSAVIEGTPGYGYNYGYNSSGYGFNVGAGDQIVEFEIDNVISNDTVIHSLALEFRATSPCMYIGEAEILATAIPANTNCRVSVNGQTVFDHADPISSNFDSYEIRMEKHEIDVWYNGKFVQNVKVPTLDSTNVTSILGVAARTSPDAIKGQFQRVEQKKYYDDAQIDVGLIGRYISIEANLRQE